jgi:dethiobiotin synthetase
LSRKARGGLAVPINDTGFMQYELIRELNIPCLLTARAGLGTINHTLLTLRFADDVGLTVKGIIINRADGSQVELDNIETIGKLSGIKSIYTLPSIAGLDAEKLQPGNLREIFAKTINIDDIVSLMEII